MRVIPITAAMAVMLAAATSAEAGTVSRKPLGDVAGSKVEAITLTNSHGVSARILSYGATLQSLIAPDRAGKPADVLLGYDDLAGYVDKPNYFGVTVGRYANRIAKARFSLDGKTFQLPANNGVNSLHGGVKGFDKVVWRVVSVESGPVARVTLAYTSPDGDQGYPGKLDVTVIYSLDEKGALSIEFNASTDKPTVVNMTNHAIFNLGGEGAPLGALGHRLTIPARAYTPVDDTLIPTGELASVEATPFDFRTPAAIGARIGADNMQIRYGNGYDHNFVLDRTNEGLVPAAHVEEPTTGRVLDVSTTEPGMQFYTGNFLDGSLAGKAGHVYKQRMGFCLETQHFPDSPNKPSFPSTILRPGDTYRSKTVFAFSVAR